MVNRSQYFEDLIDKMMIDEVSGLDYNLKAAIENGPKEKRRLGILSILDKDRRLFMSIKNIIKSNTVSKSEHISELVNMLREYVKVSEVDRKKFGEVMTPIDLVREMLNTLPKEVWSNPNLKWLDPANGVGTFPSLVVWALLMVGLKDIIPDEESRYKHIMEKMIYVCEIQPKNMFLYLCAFDPQDEYDLNIYNGDFLSKEFDNHMKNEWGIDNFDIIIGNPPYNKQLDLKFLEKAYALSDKILFVHPAGWLIDEKYINKRFIKIKDLVKNNLVSAKLFNGNMIFNIQLFVPCAITYFDKSHKGKIKIINKITDSEFEFDDIFKVNKYGTSEYISIKDKVAKHGDYINHHMDKEYNYWVNLANIRGHPMCKTGESSMYIDDFYTLATKNLTVASSKRKDGIYNQFSFETETEANNFLNYVKTNFARFCLSIYKNNQHSDAGETALIPWLDFTQEWTDEKLYEYFNITKEEVEFIERVIPKYY